MGNKAIIKTESGNIGIYLHWNGGRDSVQAFLKYCSLKGYRSPETDGYGWARLAQVIGNFFGGTTSIGIVPISGDHDGEYCDNGAYIIKEWEIVGREDFTGPEQNEYDLNEMLLAIDEKQPAEEQIANYLNAEEVNPEELKAGDHILFVDQLYGRIKEADIVGIGTPGKIVNGSDVGGVPYIGEYGEIPENNPNNYIRQPVRRVKKESAVKVSYNAELNGIEIQFQGKPDAETRDKLKKAGYRWHNGKKLWYARETESRKTLAESLTA